MDFCSLDKCVEYTLAVLQAAVLNFALYSKNTGSPAFKPVTGCPVQKGDVILEVRINMLCFCVDACDYHVRDDLNLAITCIYTYDQAPRKPNYPPCAVRAYNLFSKDVYAEIACLIRGARVFNDSFVPALRSPNKPHPT
jgi:hypothetical protein